MANGRQASAKRMKMAERAQQLMNVHFPDLHPLLVWHRNTNDGYITIPRTLPIVMQAVDAQTKGQPAGHTLFCLWARSPDHAVVVIENPATFAAEAGFVGERAVDTWRKRMKSLAQLRMIMTKPGPSGDFHYVMLVNPNTATEEMRRQGQIQDGIYARFIDRTMEIGAFGEIQAYRDAWAAWEAQQRATAQAQPLTTASEQTPPTAEATSDR